MLSIIFFEINLKKKMIKMKEEFGFIDEFSTSLKEIQSGILSSNNTESTIGIRPQPVICKPGKVNVSNCKSEPIQTKRHWAPGAWQDATRTSAFQPYKPPTLLTNLQRGNTQTEVSLSYGGSDITFYTLAGQGELTHDNIHPGLTDTPDESGLTGLMWAAGYGQLSSAKLLLNAGADKNYKGLHGQSPLHLAAAYGHHDLVKLLLNHGADPNLSEDEGNTPLIYGAQGDHPHVCYELLTSGADVTITNVYGINAYKASILKGALTGILKQ
ncbi:PREDICTED: ankyrin repeat family A protein 2-like [Ceratosolen solmsi marchali]|uniref:Ankyrin repeat family A protein 2-like n=1 Tax=Ceratosolen solmsi marchali TaxID=326594 RepID=A0AAJ7DUW0_9HYME|nr:PREDICTED: ankyrin repeat family A protein 2-like [Ceratosolen solmsi marchali]